MTTNTHDRATELRLDPGACRSSASRSAVRQGERQRPEGDEDETLGAPERPHAGGGSASDPGPDQATDECVQPVGTEPEQDVDQAEDHRLRPHGARLLVDEL